MNEAAGVSRAVDVRFLFTTKILGLAGYVTGVGSNLEYVEE